MSRYVYAFRLKSKGDEIFFQFPKLPDILSAIPKDTYSKMNASDIQNFALDAVIMALQTRIASKGEIPDGDAPNLIRADGFVNLSVQQSMKLELFKVYRENCRSVSEFARQIGKKETSVRRMLDLKHPSWAKEIETTMEILGKRLVHNWDIELAILPNRLAQPPLTSPQP
jgi:hypothetical protein